MKKINSRHYTLMGLLFLAVAANFNWNLSLKRESTGFSIMASKSQDQILEELKENCKDGDCLFESEFGEGDGKQTLKVKIEKKEINLLQEFDGLTEGGIFDTGSKKAELISLCQTELDAHEKLLKSSGATFDRQKENIENLATICRNNSPSNKKESRVIIKIKNESCDTCDWTSLIEEKNLGKIEDVAKTIYEALDEQGKQALKDYQTAQRKKLQKENCRIDDEGEDITGMYKSETRLSCLWDKKVKTEDDDTDKIDAYKEHIDKSLEKLVLSRDPQLREQAQQLVKSLKGELSVFDSRQAKDAFAVRMHRFDILSQSLNQTLLTAQACQPSSSPNARTYNQNPQMYQTLQSNVSSCIQGWEQKIRQRIEQQSNQLATLYRTIGRQTAQTVANSLKQQMNLKFQKLRQNPSSFYDMHQQSLFDDFADLAAPPTGTDPLTIPSMSSHEAFPMPSPPQQHYQPPQQRRPYYNPRTMPRRYNTPRSYVPRPGVPRSRRTYYR